MLTAFHQGREHTPFHRAFDMLNRDHGLDAWVEDAVLFEQWWIRCAGTVWVLFQIRAFWFAYDGIRKMEFISSKRATTCVMNGLSHYVRSVVREKECTFGEALEIVFKKADLDESGQMDEAEWVQFVSENKLGLNKRQAKVVFGKLATVGKGLGTIDITNLAMLLGNPEGNKKRKQRRVSLSGGIRAAGNVLSRRLSVQFMGAAKDDSTRVVPDPKTDSYRYGPKATLLADATVNVTPIHNNRAMLAPTKEQEGVENGRSSDTQESSLRPRSSISPLPPPSHSLQGTFDLQPLPDAKSNTNDQQLRQQIELYNQEQQHQEQLAKVDELRIQQQLQHQQQLEQMTEQLRKMDAQRMDQQKQHQQQLEKMDQLLGALTGIASKTGKQL
jgi:hypothetical protein